MKKRIAKKVVLSFFGLGRQTYLQHRWRTIGVACSHPNLASVVIQAQTSAYYQAEIEAASFVCLLGEKHEEANS